MAPLKRWSKAKTSISLRYVSCSACKRAHRARGLEKSRTVRTPANVGRYS